MSEWDRLRRIAETQKKLYPPGTRIELIHMGDDDPNPIPDGTRGTVTAVDDIGTVFCRFDNGRSLGMAYGADSFRALTQAELAEEATEDQNDDISRDSGPVMRM
ncbi:MAG: DUF4314 domain-containing protein [Clostridia bacterium]|nr:DUF4314 domain-containing protein [Clostridia bacterium]